MSKPNPQAAIPLPASVAEKVKSKSTVKVGGHQVGGWGEIAKTVTTRDTYHNKPNPDDWNQVDLQWFLKNRYAEKYGYMMNIPIQLGHKCIADIKHQMMKRLGEMPKHSILKDYFDYCIERLADDIIRAEGAFTIHKITKPKYILDYIDKANVARAIAQPQSPLPIVQASAVVDALTMDDLTASFRINSQYMVSNYGIVIPINFLISMKGKTLDEAIAYVQGAMTKLAAKGPQEMGAVISATNKYQPYPRWLRFTDVSKVVKMTIAISDDNSVFNVFKEQK